MKLRDLNTNPHLTVTVHQWSSVCKVCQSVNFVVFINSNTTAVSLDYLNPPKQIPTANCPTWLYPLPRCELERSLEERIATPQAASALPYLAWLVAVISGTQNEEKNVCCVRVESCLRCWCVLNSLPHPLFPITPSTWITSSQREGWVSYISPLVVAWNENGCAWRSAVKLWRCVCSIWISFKRSNFFILLSICTQIRNSQHHSTSEDISLRLSILLCSWICSSSFNVRVITLSNVLLHTVKVVQYL
jgi:hypothetical protein